MRRRDWIRQVTALLAGAFFVVRADAADVTLRPGVPILMDEGEAAPIHRAVQDLQRDLKKVFGKDSPVVNDAAAVKGKAAIVVTCRGAQTAALRDASLAGTEAHAVRVREGGGAPRVVLQGTDTRGTIYALYTFSDRFLDIPPLWFWASWQPPKKQAITVPGGTHLRFPSPHVPWRAWFPNDTDLFTPWERKSGANYEAMFETMLRLKLNVLDVGDIRDFPQPNRGLRWARTAKARGLAVTTTHIAPLGASFRNWDEYWRTVQGREPPALSLANADKFDAFWAYFIDLARREQLEMIWMIGFRGAGDQGFFETVQGAPKGDAERARVIRQMMRQQIDLLRKATGDPHPRMRTVLYNENSDYFAQGLFRPPDDPDLIWNFVGARRDHFPAADLRGYTPPKNRLIGYYLNLQFTSTGSHLAQGEGPWKMERNYRMVEAAGPGPLVFSVVNMGNLREFVMEASANAALLWDWEGYRTDAFLDAFCARYFGPEHGKKVASLYRDFYAAYWQQKKGDLPGFERQYLFQDQRLARAGEALLRQIQKGAFSPNPFDDRGTGYFRIVPADSGATNQVDAVLRGTEASAQKLRAVTAACDALLPALAPTGRAFLNDNLRVQAHFLLQVNRWLHALARAFQSLPDREETRTRLVQAGQANEAMRRVLAEAEHGAFAGWYDGDDKFGVKHLKERVSQAIRRIGDGARAPGR